MVVVVAALVVDSLFWQSLALAEASQVHVSARAFARLLIAAGCGPRTCFDGHVLNSSRLLGAWGRRRIFGGFSFGRLAVVAGVLHNCNFAHQRCAKVLFDLW